MVPGQARSGARYAFGILAYVILTGAHPFAHRSPAAMLAAHLTEIPEDVRAQRADITAELGGQAAGAAVPSEYEQSPGDASDPTIRIKIQDADLSVDFGNASE